jgi:hypothetical protein
MKLGAWVQKLRNSTYASIFSVEEEIVTKNKQSPNLSTYLGPNYMFRYTLCLKVTTGMIS